MNRGARSQALWDRAAARARAASFGLLLLAGACVKPPVPLEVEHVAAITPREALQQQVTAQQVRWGGEIVTTSPRRDETCFEIIHHPLDAQARPRETDQSDGRYVACAPGFYDPAVYAQGREITVVGTLEEATTGTIGEHEYRYPVVASEVVYLWPKREQATAYYVPEPWPPFYYWRPWYHHHPFHPHHPWWW